jgi:hypothetical protein
MAFAVFPCRFLVVRISPTRTGQLNSHHQQSPMRVEGIHMTGCCPVPQRDRLRHCYHYLSVMQSSARCLAPCLRWTRALFAVLGRYPSPRRGRQGVDFGGIGLLKQSGDLGSVLTAFWSKIHRRDRSLGRPGRRWKI